MHMYVCMCVCVCVIVYVYVYVYVGMYMFCVYVCMDGVMDGWINAPHLNLCYNVFPFIYPSIDSSIYPFIYPDIPRFIHPAIFPYIYSTIRIICYWSHAESECPFPVGVRPRCPEEELLLLNQKTNQSPIAMPTSVEISSEIQTTRLSSHEKISANRFLNTPLTTTKK